MFQTNEHFSDAHFIIYLPYFAFLFPFIAAINWQLRENVGEKKLCSCWDFETFETEEMLVCNCDLFGFLHLLSLCYWSFLFCFCFCFLHIQNHLDSMQVFSSYFSSKFSLSSPCDSLG